MPLFSNDIYLDLGFIFNKPTDHTRWYLESNDYTTASYIILRGINRTWNSVLWRFVLMFQSSDETMTRNCFLHCWYFVRGIHWSQVDFSHKCPLTQSFGIFSHVSPNKLLNTLLTCQWFERPCLSYDVTRMTYKLHVCKCLHHMWCCLWDR